MISSSETSQSSPLPSKSRIIRSGYAIRAPWAVGISVQTKSTVPDSSAISMAGADSCGGTICASGIWGRQESYQIVPLWLVQLPPARSEIPLASANLLPCFTRQTMVAYRYGPAKSTASMRSDVMLCPAITASHTPDCTAGIRESQSSCITSSCHPFASQIALAVITSYPFA